MFQNPSDFLGGGFRKCRRAWVRQVLRHIEQRLLLIFKMAGDYQRSRAPDAQPFFREFERSAHSQCRGREDHGVEGIENFFFENLGYINRRGLQKTSPAAALNPVHEAPIVAPAPEFQLKLKLKRPAVQREYVLGRVLYQLKLRGHQFQRTQNVVIFFLMPLKERHVAFETDAPFGLAEECEELLGAIVQSCEDPIQFARSKLLGARYSGDVPNQFLKLVIAHARAEVFPNYIFDLVRFIE